MKRLAARRYAGLLILSPTAAADPDSHPADCTQVNLLLHVFLSPQALVSARVHRMGREEEMDKMCVCMCKCMCAWEGERATHSFPPCECGFVCVSGQGERGCVGV